MRKIDNTKKSEIGFYGWKKWGTYRSVAEEFNRTHPQREKPLN